MNIENHMYNARNMLNVAQSKIEAQDYDSALALLCSAYSNVRNLIEQVYKTSIDAARAERPAVETPGGP